jgi:hypothetical protein
MRGPEKFFTEGEKAVWRNLNAWVLDGTDEDTWVTLPGPADWWPIDIDATGFFFPEQGPGYKEAFMMIDAEGEPADGSYDLLCPGDGILRVMANNAESRALLQAHRNLIA